ncbi:MAG: aminotransferase class I/II-fold pyridoxal phosphate-dependent enzyme [Spirochaetes bacterium]|nr:aminotransferase class I/II-fold pyridoxal phosphate-dependent enzyme [Spirochaetota bacterium]
MPKISLKSRSFGESVIRRMTRVALRHGAINLSQGFPDFDPPQALREAAAHAAIDGPHQYAVTWGAENFRQALAAKQSRFMGIPIDPGREITVTCGATEAMMAAVMTAVDPGDKIVVFSPFYENYLADAVLAGAEPLCVPLRPQSSLGGEFTFDPDELAAAFESGAKALILCNPANPTGKVFTKEELETIAALAERYDAFVITDEVYEHIVYAPNVHSYFAALPGMFDRTISCSSLSKTYSITGWRLGYVIAPARVTDGIRKVHDFLTVGAAAPLQEAAVTALGFDDAYYRDLGLLYSGKRELFLSYLEKAGLSYVRPQGAYYVLVDISEFGARSDTAFCEWMASEAGLAAVPGSSFFKDFEDRFIRFHFAKKDETLKAAGERLFELRARWAESSGNVRG